MMTSSQSTLIKSCARVHFYSQQQCLKKKSRLPDMIGPVDPISNLHPIKYGIHQNETLLEKKLRKHREELQEWNDIFWTKHNLNFIQSKKNFEKLELAKKNSDKQILSADEISVFYKKFLDENWNDHTKYLLKWYKQSFYVNFLHFLVKVQNLYKIIGLLNKNGNT